VVKEGFQADTFLDNFQTEGILPYLTISHHVRRRVRERLAKKWTENHITNALCKGLRREELSQFLLLKERMERVERKKKWNILPIIYQGKLFIFRLITDHTTQEDRTPIVAVSCLYLTKEERREAETAWKLLRKNNNQKYWEMEN
jgi:hypothetical protein